MLNFWNYSNKIERGLEGKSGRDESNFEMRGMVADFAYYGNNRHYSFLLFCFSFLFSNVVLGFELNSKTSIKLEFDMAGSSRSEVPT